MPFGLWTRVGRKKYALYGAQIPHAEGQLLGERTCPMTLCHELCKNGSTDRFAVWVVDSGGLKEAQVQSYLPGGDNVPSWEDTLAPPGGGNAVLCQITFTT